MFFLIPEDKKVLIFYILIILLGIILEHFHILETEKTIALCLLIAITIYLFKTFITHKKN